MSPAWNHNYNSQLAGAHRKGAKVGEVPTVRSSDTDTDLPIVSADLLTNFRSGIIASSLKTDGF